MNHRGEVFKQSKPTIPEQIHHINPPRSFTPIKPESFNIATGWGRFVSFRFRFPGTGCLAFRFVGAYGSVRFAEMIGSFRFVSHLLNIFSVSFRFVSVSQTVCDFSVMNYICWKACGSEGLESRFETLFKSNVKNAA